MSKLNWTKQTCFAFLLCAATAIALPAQTFKTLFSFDGTDGGNPQAGLVQATDGNFYGTTQQGGVNNFCPGGDCGTVFKISPTGNLTTFYSFCSQPNCTDGETPLAALVQGTDGDFYGTTFEGGSDIGGCFSGGCGVIFKITPSGTLTTLHSFCFQGGSCPDGANPLGGLVQDTSGTLYGTTYYGGANGSGTVIRITRTGAFTTLYSFCSQSGCKDGSLPQAGLIQATDGNFYGTTSNGGEDGSCGIFNGCGTVFKIASSGALTTLHTFCSQSGCADGGDSEAGLIQATDGNFYGTTFGGGSNCAPYGCGTVFKITPNGTFTTLHSFCSQSNCTDGNGPWAGLVQATDGNFYGTTYSGGGVNGGGTIFRITPSGTLTTLYTFCSQSRCSDGEDPRAALIQGTDGNLYGTTWEGGAIGNGTVFSLSVGLGPFVETEPTSGKAGSVIKILGTDLTGAINVTFNGTPAVFKVLSSSLIGATVPEGATTGPVVVTTPSGTLTSNVNFRVQP
jgi:uncharacterized repeat protein (TIGR03803 family)